MTFQASIGGRFPLDANAQHVGGGNCPPEKFWDEAESMTDTMEIAAAKVILAEPARHCPACYYQFTKRLHPDIFKMRTENQEGESK